jgi:hypothetical protein
LKVAQAIDQEAKDEEEIKNLLEMRNIFSMLLFLLLWLLIDMVMVMVLFAG